MKVPISFMFNSSRICLNNIVEMTLQKTDSYSKVKIGLSMIKVMPYVCISF